MNVTWVETWKKNPGLPVREVQRTAMTESGMEEIEVYQAISLSFQEAEPSMAKGKDVRSLTCWVTDASPDQTSKKKSDLCDFSETSRH